MNSTDETYVKYTLGRHSGCIKNSGQVYLVCKIAANS